MILLAIVLLYLAWDAVVTIETWRRINVRITPPDRTLTPTTLSKWHAFMFFIHKLNYFAHITLSTLTVCVEKLCGATITDKQELSDRVVELIIGSSFCIFLEPVTPENGFDPRSSKSVELSNPYLYKLDLDDFSVCYYPGKVSNHLYVELDVKERVVSRFTWNGSELSNPLEQLTLLFDVGSTYIHPLIHSYNGTLYEQRHRVDDKYDRLFRHGQNLNEAAHDYPSIGYGCSKDWFKSCIEEDAARQIPVHNFKTLFKLSNFSPFVNFCLEARVACFKLIRKHKVKQAICPRCPTSMQVGVDPELFFICSIMHSIDHGVYGRLHQGIDFEENDLFRGFQTFTYRFFHGQVSVKWFMDNSLKGNAGETEFYSELYDTLRAVNPLYADTIELSISS